MKTRFSFRLAILTVVPVFLGALSLAGVAVPAAQAASLPCDIYAAGGTPCVAAHSTTRALYAAYNGPLYQVRRASDGATTNIGLLSAGGYANAAAQDSFCAGTTCTITEIYDQSGTHNDLTIGPAGGAGGADVGANATALPVTAGGHKVYGVYITPGTATATTPPRAWRPGRQPEGVYMVASGTHVNSGCCFDYGNAETNTATTATATWTRSTSAPRAGSPPCTGSGPWVQADLENGMFPGGNGNNPSEPGQQEHVRHRAGEEQRHHDLRAQGRQRPVRRPDHLVQRRAAHHGGYSPMHQEGAIILGIGGDNSNGSAGDVLRGRDDRRLPDRRRRQRGPGQHRLRRLRVPQRRRRDRADRGR